MKRISIEEITQNEFSYVSGGSFTDSAKSMVTSPINKALEFHSNHPNVAKFADIYAVAALITAIPIMLTTMLEL